MALSCTPSPPSLSDRLKRHPAVAASLARIAAYRRGPRPTCPEEPPPTPTRDPDEVLAALRKATWEALQTPFVLSTPPPLSPLPPSCQRRINAMYYTSDTSGVGRVAALLDPFYGSGVAHPPQDTGYLCTVDPFFKSKRLKPYRPFLALFCQGFEDHGHAWRFLRPWFPKTLCSELEKASSERPREPLSSAVVAETLTSLFTCAHREVRRAIEADSDSYGEDNLLQPLALSSLTVIFKYGDDVYLTQAGNHQVLLCTPGYTGYHIHRVTQVDNAHPWHLPHALGGLENIPSTPQTTLLHTECPYMAPTEPKETPSELFRSQGAFLWFGTSSFWRYLPHPPGAMLASYCTYLSAYEKTMPAEVPPPSFPVWALEQLEKVHGPPIRFVKPMTALLSFPAYLAERGQGIVPCDPPYPQEDT